MLRPTCFAAVLAALPIFLTADDTDGEKSVRAGERAKARVLMNEGKMDEAGKFLKKYLKEEKEDWEARVLLGRIELETGDLESAEKQFRKAAEGEDVEGMGRLAEVMAMTGRLDEAKTTAEDAIKKDAGALNARVALGALLLETGKGDEAEKVLEWLQQHVEKTAELTGTEKFTCARGIWLLALRRGDKDLIRFIVDGGNLLNGALDAEDIPDAEVLAFWGHCYIDKYNTVYAKNCFEDALKKNAKSASAMYGMGRVLAEGGRVPQAMAAADQALQVNPKLLDALIFKGALQSQLQQYGPSGDSLKAALKINPRSVQALAVVAANHEVQGQKDEREKVEAKLKEINPNCGLAWYLIGSALGNKMLFEEAQVYLQKAVEADPKLWDAYIEHGMNALRLGDEVTALKYLTTAYERDPFHIRLVNTMTLMDAFPKDFVVLETKHFRLRIHKKEVDLIGPYVVDLHEKAWDTLAKRYGFEPKVPIVCDMYPNHNDFSVRTVGMSGLGALGACFGRVCTLLSPRAKEVMGKFNWGSVVWHELGHVWALQLSKNRVPRWFTEGLSTYEEKLGYPGWGRELEAEMYMAFQAKKLMKIDQLHAGGDLLNLYLYGSLITEHIATSRGFDKIPAMLRMWGEGKDTKAVFQAVLGVTTDKFDEEMQEFLKGWLADVKLRLPFAANAQEIQKLEAAVDENPMDADSMGRLARILFGANRKGDAETLAKKTLKIDEDNVDALIVMADSMGTAERRRFDAAADFYKRAIAAGATDYQTKYAYAKMQEKAANWDGAIEAYREAKKAFPRHIAGEENPYRRLIAIFETERKDAAALQKELEELASMDHDSFKLRMQLAKIYKDKNEPQKLMEQLEAALYIGVFDSQLHAWLGGAYRDAAKHEKALHEFKACVIMLREAEESKPGKWQMQIAKYNAEAAAMAKELGKMEEARTLAKEAILADPQNELGRKVLESLDK